MSAASERSFRKHAELATLLANMPRDLYSSMSSASDFKHDAFAEYSTKFLSLMGYATIVRIAVNLDGLDLKFLPKFLGTIGSASKTLSKESESSNHTTDILRAHRLSALQFLHAQFHGNGHADGLLREWATANPMAALALTIAALLYNNEPLVAYWRKKSSKSGIRRNRSGSIVCRSKAAIINDYLLTFLSHTEFFQSMRSSFRADLLILVGEALRATKEDPRMKLERRAVELRMAAIQNPEDPQCVILMMQSSLQVANIAHIFRREPSTHVGWSANRMGLLQGTRLAADTDAKFSLSVLDIGSLKYNSAHAMVLKSMIVPLVSLWIKAATRDAADKSHPLCAQALALGSKYETMEPSLVPNMDSEWFALNGSKQQPDPLSNEPEVKLPPTIFEESDKTCEGLGMPQHTLDGVLLQEGFRRPAECINEYVEVSRKEICLLINDARAAEIEAEAAADFFSVCKIYELV